MFYGGFYPKEAVPCLKAALMANYTKGIFNAGRGKDMYVKGDYIYMIAPQEPCSFERFFAREGIRNKSDDDGLKRAGGHKMWGMALI